MPLVQAPEVRDEAQRHVITECPEKTHSIEKWFLKAAVLIQEGEKWRATAGNVSHEKVALFHAP